MLGMEARLLEHGHLLPGYSPELQTAVSAHSAGTQSLSAQAAELQVC